MRLLYLRINKNTQPNLSENSSKPVECDMNLRKSLRTSNSNGLLEVYMYCLGYRFAIPLSTYSKFGKLKIKTYLHFLFLRIWCTIPTDTNNKHKDF